MRTGDYPKGNSPFGLADMVGNVWLGFCQNKAYFRGTSLASCDKLGDPRLQEHWSVFLTFGYIWYHGLS